MNRIFLKSASSRYALSQTNRAALSPSALPRGPETGLWEVNGMFPVRLGIVRQLCVPFVCRSSSDSIGDGDRTSRLTVGQPPEHVLPWACGTVVCLTWARFSSQQQRRLVPVEGSIVLVVTAPWIALDVSAEQKFSTSHSTRYGLWYGSAQPTIDFQRLTCRPPLLSRCKYVPILL